jgi:hypothetical protein
LAQTEAALARHTLLQAASLPNWVESPAARLEGQGQRLTFEVPFATPQGTSIAQFEIRGDGGGTAAEPHLKVWRVRFSLDVEPAGPVHAQVTLLGVRVAVTLWAERPAAAAQLSEKSPMLADALRAAALEPGDIQLRAGVPSTPRGPAAGRFLDRAS